MKSKNSYLTLVASMLIFGTIGIFRRLIPLSSAMLSFARGVMGSVFLLLLVKARGRRLFVQSDKKKIILLMITGALIGLNWMFLFEAYNYTTVGTATLCYYMQPTILILLSPIFLKESLSGRKILRAVIAIIGMILVSGVIGGGRGVDEVRGILYGLAAAALYAAVVITNKKVTVEDPYEKTIVQLASAALVMVPYLLLTGNLQTVELGGVEVIMLLIVGIVHTGIAYAFYFAGMEGVRSQTIAILSYIDPVSALILSAIFLHERMDIYGIIGAVLIIGTALWDSRDGE